MTEILKKQLENNSISHAYLFEGIDEEENLKRAKEFAQNIFLKENISKSLDLNEDFRLIQDINGVITIDEIRAFRKDLFLKPHNGKIKVYIIHNCHNLRKESANAMLKSLEEPSEFAVIILTANNRGNLLNTILSRCQIIHFDDCKKDSQVDKSKLSEIIYDILKGDLSFYFRNIDFFNSYKDKKYELLDGFEEFFKDILNYKYTKDVNSLTVKTWITKIEKLTYLSIDQIEEICQLIIEIKKSFKNNLAYQLSIEHLIFSIWRFSN
ncbi:MAG: DNA polymerase III subunit delta' [Tissierellia bacterium]|nr:DNA polymerase III subunit delta' [Tissierellia bacterium]